MVTVSGILLSADNRQNLVKSAREKTSGEGFYDFLSKSMAAVDSAGKAGKDRTLPLSSSGMQRKVKYETVASDGVKSGTGAFEKCVDKLSEIPVADAKDLEKESEGLLYLIEEIIAVLNKLTLFFENVEPDKAAGTVSFPAEIELALSRKITELINVMNNTTDVSVKENLENLVNELGQILLGNNVTVITESADSAAAGQTEELIAQMLNEAENLKAEIIARTTVNDGMNPESGETNLSDGDIDVQESVETSAPEQDNSKDQNPENRLKEKHESRKVSTEDSVTVYGRLRLNAAQVQNDFGRVAENQSLQNEQMSELKYVPSEKFSIINKENIIHQVAEKVKVLTTSDRSEMVIQLKPESLGRIQLQVIHERGEIIAKFLAESEQVKAILESNMQMLRDALEKSGVDIQSLSVSVGQQYDRNDGNDRNDYRNRHVQGGLRVFYEEQPVSADMLNTYQHTGLSDDLYGYAGSEINLIA
ncbi:flagellar hook-length control protein FliK [Thermoclostridium stercorarium]|jgi:flagellar hook-length control protein FliK|uniref:Flagellar hook-length control protein FliK n=1 Tax=Thermoclostridium stercorarium subsp. leptospartum DSM 9219 TaxID=1346611 RepID=A0A1B1YIF2_THEST|nr:flagellar hook-length control protein FliK [Thermoclostridium stercorarium]ANX00560.1 flagellar hook-length control protein FliK [Thermoclostridium stercorarium subsp. leptospartum DSM 9219]UZQ86173.1 flagellar hook-length control protein FliK [Thermoclostridium stercorarium]